MYGMFLQGGAQGISIAVEPEVYGGSWDMVSTVSRISSIPVMARDVFIHPAMICQAIVSGADAVNLVAAALPAKDLSELYRMASGLGLDVMMEVHTLKELETVMDLEAGNSSASTMQTRTLSRPILQSRRNSLKKYPPPSLSCPQGASAPWKTRAACWTQEPMAFFSKTNLPAWIFPRISWRPFWLSGRTDFPLTIL